MAEERTVTITISAKNLSAARGGRMTSPPQDERRVCRDCGRDFVWTVVAQQYFAQRHFQPPKRCKLCAAAKRELEQARAGQASADPRAHRADPE